MNKIFRILAPDGLFGMVLVGVAMMCMVVTVDLAFVYIVDGAFVRPVWFHTLQAVIVGGPFVTLFVVISMFQIKLQRRLSLLSRKDGLTGLNNRRTFLELAQKRLDGGSAGVLVLLDADHFKRINDQWGHAAGDICLKEIAHRLNWNLRPDDVVGRIGGEEFAVLFSGANLHQARVIGGRIGKPIPFQTSDKAQHLSVTLSMGAVEIEPSVSLDTHFVRADDALYQAKAKGRARMIVWKPTGEAQGNVA